jgi:hypothetical protein
LPKRDDPTWPSLHGLLECGSRNTVIAGKSNQFLDVPFLVVPKLDRVRKIVGSPHCHFRM